MTTTQGREPVTPYPSDEQNAGAVTSDCQSGQTDVNPTPSHAQGREPERAGGQWKLVPVEPTPDMVSAAYREQPDAINAGFAQGYRDMLAAAPPPDSAEILAEFRQNLATAKAALSTPPQAPGVVKPLGERDVVAIIEPEEGGEYTPEEQVNWLLSDLNKKALVRSWAVGADALSTLVSAPPVSTVAENAMVVPSGEVGELAKSLRWLAGDASGKFSEGDKSVLYRAAAALTAANERVHYAEGVVDHVTGDVIVALRANGLSSLAKRLNDWITAANADRDRLRGELDRANELLSSDELLERVVLSAMTIDSLQADRDRLARELEEAREAAIEECASVVDEVLVAAKEAAAAMGVTGTSENARRVELLTEIASDLRALASGEAP